MNMARYNSTLMEYLNTATIGNVMKDQLGEQRIVGKTASLSSIPRSSLTISCVMVGDQIYYYYLIRSFGDRRKIIIIDVGFSGTLVVTRCGHVPWKPHCMETVC